VGSSANVLDRWQPPDFHVKTVGTYYVKTVGTYYMEAVRAYTARLVEQAYYPRKADLAEAG
jgi:hypothetical protein